VYSSSVWLIFVYMNAASGPWKKCNSKVLFCEILTLVAHRLRSIHLTWDSDLNCVNCLLA
jgi:hypothetical protein